MKKKNICILFALIIIILLIPIVTISAASSNNQKLPFSDVDENSKYYDSITYIYDYGILTGTTLSNGEQRFYPKNKTDRLTLAIALYRIAGCPEPVTTDELPFVDISGMNSFQKKALKWCFENNIILGTSKDKFSPDNYITREQFVTILYRYVTNYRKEKIVDVGLPKNITDEKKISQYSKNAISWAISENIIAPSNGQIKPKENMTREVVAKKLADFVKKRNIIILNWKMKNNKSFYSDLSNEEYANFRMVKTTGIQEKMLYRGFSPIDNAAGDNRTTYVAERLKSNKIKIIINLADTEKSAKKHNDYGNLKKYCPNAYVVYCYIPDITRFMLTNDQIPEFEQTQFNNGLRKALKFMAKNKGPYYIHCKYGKDRTGLTMIILESLMGASFDEIENDYIKSYENYFQIRGTENHVVLPIQKKKAHNKLMEIYRRILHVDDTENASSETLKTAIEKYLQKEIKLSKKDIDSLRNNIGTKK